MKYDRNVYETLAASLADDVHRVWAEWMRYMLSQGTYTSDGGWHMPAEKLKRWRRQMNTEYYDLPISEQKSDVEIAEKYVFAFMRYYQECGKPVRK